MCIQTQEKWRCESTGEQELVRVIFCKTEEEGDIYNLSVMEHPVTSTHSISVSRDIKSSDIKTEKRLQETGNSLAGVVWQKSKRQLSKPR